MLRFFLFVLFFAVASAQSTEISADPEDNRIIWSCAYGFVPWPVCGLNRRTYINRCMAQLAGVTVLCNTPCLFCPESPGVASPTPATTTAAAPRAGGIDSSGFICDSSGSSYLNDCGRGAVSEQECLNRDCCYHEFGQGSEEPWCFFKNSGYNYCANHLYRSDCGELSTTEEECKARGCCWDVFDSLPSCFFENSNIDQSRCQIPVEDRRPCGDGTNQQTCESSGCCWWPLEEGSEQPWCYTPSSSSSMKTLHRNDLSAFV